MEENRAAAPPNPRLEIVIENDKCVVDPVGAPKLFVSRADWPLRQAIVSPVSRIVAPKILTPDRAGGKQSRRAGQSFGSVEQGRQPKTPDRRGDIALFFARDCPCRAKRAMQNHEARRQPAARAIPGNCRNADSGYPRQRASAPEQPGVTGLAVYANHSHRWPFNTYRSRWRHNITPRSGKNTSMRSPRNDKCSQDIDCGRRP